LIARDDLQRMRDRLYQLEAALQDAEADLAAGSELDEVHAAVVAVARRVALTWIEPIAVHGLDQPR
jgi:hypothetical protein